MWISKCVNISCTQFKYTTMNIHWHAFSHSIDEIKETKQIEKICKMTWGKNNENVIWDKNQEMQLFDKIVQYLNTFPKVWIIR